MQSVMQKIFYIMNFNGLLLAFFRRSVILGYHRIDVPNSSLLHTAVDTVLPKNFKNHLNYLLDLRFKFVTIKEIIANYQEINVNKRMPKLAVISFDDGYRDLYDTAFPIMRELGVPFILFLNTSTVGATKLLWIHRVLAALDKVDQSRQRTLLANELDADPNHGLEFLLAKLFRLKDYERLENISGNLASTVGLTDKEEHSLCLKLYLDDMQINEMVSYGATVECHTHKHYPLGSLDIDSLKNDLKTNNEIIRRHFGVKPCAMSVPFGISPGLAAKIYRKLDLSAVCTSQKAMVSPGSDVSALPRIFPTGDLLEFSTSITRMLLKEVPTPF